MSRVFHAIIYARQCLCYNVNACHDRHSALKASLSACQKRNSYGFHPLLMSLCSIEYESVYLPTRFHIQSDVLGVWLTRTLQL